MLKTQKNSATDTKSKKQISDENIVLNLSQQMIIDKTRSVANNFGAINALKGYRAQFVYSLNRILGHHTGEATFRPEGKFEDLDIYDKEGKVIEIIQVKNLSKTLTLSD